MSKSYRLYTFINFYLSQIQQGIQTAHIVHELFNKHPIDFGGAATVLRDWSEDHKTIIVLNGGDGRAITEMYGVASIMAEKLQLPIVDFYEDEGLGNIRTGFGVVLPEEIFNARQVDDGFADNTASRPFVFVKLDDKGNEEVITHDEGTEEFNFIKLLKQKRLA